MSFVITDFAVPVLDSSMCCKCCCYPMSVFFQTLTANAYNDENYDWYNITARQRR